MKILQVNGSWRTLGGAEVYLHQLVHGLRGRGHEVAVFAGDPEQEKEDPLHLIVRRPDFDFGTLIEDPQLADRFLSFAARFKPDVIHAHNLYALPASFVRTMWEVGVPLLLHPHEYGLLCTNSWCVLPDGTPCEGGPGAKCFERPCVENYPFDARNVLAARLRYVLARDLASAVVSGSDSLSGMLDDHGFRSVETLRYFAEPEKFSGRDALRQVMNENPRKRDRLLFAGRLEPEKGVGYLLEAMPLVLEKRPKAELHIVGDGSLSEQLREQADALGLGSSVVFHGKVPHTDMPRFLAESTLQVLPSIWYENAAQSCYDCLLMGLPLIASDIAALPGVVRDGVTGFLATPRDPRSIAEKAVRLLEDERLCEQMAKACEAELEFYDKDRHLGRLEDLYRELVEGAADRPEIESLEPDTIVAIREIAGSYEQVLADCVEAHERSAEAHRMMKEMRGGRVRQLVNGLLDRAFRWGPK